MRYHWGSGIGHMYSRDQNSNYGNAKYVPSEENQGADNLLEEDNDLDTSGNLGSEVLAPSQDDDVLDDENDELNKDLDSNTEEEDVEDDDDDLSHVIGHEEMWGDIDRDDCDASSYD